MMKYGLRHLTSRNIWKSALGRFFIFKLKVLAKIMKSISQQRLEQRRVFEGALS